MKKEIAYFLTGCLITAFIIVVPAALVGEKKMPVYVEYFKEGQILLPTYGCSDTLIVRDAIGLNIAFAPIEQGIAGKDFGDSDYDYLFHAYCDYYINPIK